MLHQRYKNYIFLSGHFQALPLSGGGGVGGGGGGGGGAVLSGFNSKVKN